MARNPSSTTTTPDWLGADAAPAHAIQKALEMAADNARAAGAAARRSVRGAAVAAVALTVFLVTSAAQAQTHGAIGRVQQSPGEQGTGCDTVGDLRVMGTVTTDRTQRDDSIGGRYGVRVTTDSTSRRVVLGVRTELTGRSSDVTLPTSNREVSRTPGIRREVTPTSVRGLVTGRSSTCGVRPVGSRLLVRHRRIPESVRNHRLSSVGGLQLGGAVLD